MPCAFPKRVAWWALRALVAGCERRFGKEVLVVDRRFRLDTLYVPSTTMQKL